MVINEAGHIHPRAEMIALHQFLEMDSFRTVTGQRQLKIQTILGQKTAGFQEIGKAFLGHKPAQGQDFIGR